MLLPPSQSPARVRVVHLQCRTSNAWARCSCRPRFYDAGLFLRSICRCVSASTMWVAVKIHPARGLTLPRLPHKSLRLPSRQGSQSGASAVSLAFAGCPWDQINAMAIVTSRGSPTATLANVACTSTAGRRGPKRCPQPPEINSCTSTIVNVHRHLRQLASKSLSIGLGNPVAGLRSSTTQS